MRALILTNNNNEEKIMNTQTKLYQDATLNRLAVENNWGRVFGEETMLKMLKNAPDEKTFVEDINFELSDYE